MHTTRMKSTKKEVGSSYLACNLMRGGPERNLRRGFISVIERIFLSYLLRISFFAQFLISARYSQLILSHIWIRDPIQYLRNLYINVRFYSVLFTVRYSTRESIAITINHELQKRGATVCDSRHHWILRFGQGRSDLDEWCYTCDNIHIFYSNLIFPQFHKTRLWAIVRPVA